MLQRVDAMEGELGALVESLRTGANRLSADLSLLSGNMGELYAAAGQAPAEDAAVAYEPSAYEPGASSSSRRSTSSRSSRTSRTTSRSPRPPMPTPAPRAGCRRTTRRTSRARA